MRIQRHFAQEISDADSSSSEDSLTPSFKILTPLQRGVSVSILNDCLDKLQLLRFVFHLPADNAWNQVFKYKTLEERFTTREEQYELEGSFHFTDVQKFLKDLCFVRTVIAATAEEIALSGRFLNIKTIVEDENRRVIDDETLLEEYRMNKIQIEALKLKLMYEKQDHRKILDKKQKEANQMEEQLSILEERLRYENKYVNNWERTRREQNKMKQTLAKREIHNKIDDFNKNIELEERVHYEIETFLEESRQDYLTEIEEWIQKYDKELEDFESEILKTKMKREQVEARLNYLKLVYSSRQKEIEEWLVVREQIRQEEELRERQKEAARKLQAWWRGVMVRRKLGRFSNKKRKGKGKGKGKGGKQNKNKNKKGGKKK